MRHRSATFAPCAVLAWMASHAGADWRGPDAKTLARIRREAARRIDAHIIELTKMKRELEAHR